ncbi:MAG: LCP family protein [Oscillospiraceae bacterium]
MANRPHSYNSGRIHRAGAPSGAQAAALQPRQPVRPAKPAKKKKRRWPIVLTVFLVILGLGAGGVAWLYNYVDNAMDPGAAGVIASENYTPEEYQGDVINILIVGIDNEEGRGYGAGLGQTDMILYANYDLANNKLNLLQIPRDSYVGENTGGNGKINALMITGTDQENPINNLVNYISTKFKLPVDKYVALDMDAMKEIVDKLGGLYVYVAQDMSYGGSSLQQGWRMLDGEAAEFFVRNRHGTGFERADIDRLDNQRHFYSALFRRLMNLTPGDVLKLIPTFQYFCSTDISMGDVASLGVSALKLDPANVLFCKVPGATGGELDPTGQGRDFYYIDVYGRGTAEEPGLAGLLNQYFRTYGEQVPADQLGLPSVSIPSSVTLYSPNVQMMGEVQAVEGGSDIDVEPR